VTDEPAVKQQLVNVWVAGYFTGFEKGIKQAAWMLRKAKEHHCPVPDECADALVAMGIALKKQANKMTHEEADALREENSDG
jgi:hypothetical protein